LLPINKKRKLILLALGASLIACLAINILFARLPASWNLSKNLDIFFYNLFFTPTLSPPGELVIIDSIEIKEKEGRSEYAAMIRQLHNAGAACIALDVYFLEEYTLEPEKDRELIKSIVDCPNVVLAVDFSEGKAIDALQMRLLDSLALSEATCDEFIRKIYRKSANLPFNSLLSVVRNVGHINSAQEEYYHFPPAIFVGRKCFAALPVQITKIYFESIQDSFQNSVHLANADSTNNNSPVSFSIADIPLDMDDQMFVSFIREQDFKPVYSWDEALRQVEASPHLFKNKVVLIIKSAGETLINSPFGAYPRWAYIASITSQLLQNRHIEASVIFYPIVFSVMLITASLVWLLFVAPRMHEKWRRTRYLFLINNGLFLIVIFLLLRFWQQWIGVVVPLLMLNTGMIVVRELYYRAIKPPRYEEFVIQVLEKRGNVYPQKISKSPAGEDTSDLFFESFLNGEKFKAVMQRLKAWCATEEDIKWMGETLFEALFQPEVYQIFKNSLEKVEREKKYLKIKLSIDPAELVGLPWELMRNADLVSDYIALHERVSLVRYLSLSQPLKKMQNRRPFKILIFSSGADDLEIADEKKAIDSTLRPFIRSRDIELKFCEGATVEKLSRELKNGRPDILHYIGHADFDEEKNEAYLDFASGEKVSARKLKSLMQAPSVKLAILNSCKTSTAAETDAFTGLAQNLVKAGIPAVVAMQFKIPDTTAIWFSDIFYSALFEMYSIDAAITQTRRTIMERTDLDQQYWGTPVLFMRTDGDTFFSQSTA
jgi:CHASE2 domain-containing sensor protein